MNDPGSFKFLNQFDEKDIAKFYTRMGVKLITHVTTTDVWNASATATARMSSALWAEDAYHHCLMEQHVSQTPGAHPGIACQMHVFDRGFQNDFAVVLSYSWYCTSE